LVAVIESYD